MQKAIRKTSQSNHRVTTNNKTQGRISKFILLHFKSDFVTDMRSGYDHQGALIHQVDVNHDNTIYHLQFNDRGDLVQVGAEPIMMVSDIVGEYLN